MTRDDIIAMAREAGKTKWFGTHPDGTSDFLGAEFSPEQLERFAALVAAAEREACAQMLDEASGTGRIISCTHAAATIRARGETK